VNVEDQVVLNQFKLRPYQVEVFDAIENKETKRVVYIAARRSGKDILGWNLAIRQCIKRVCQVYYVLPTYGQARKAIWDAITIDGRKFLDFIPPQLIDNMNQTEMKIRFTNGSLLQLIGGDSFSTSIVGSNPYAVILSEYSLMPPDIFSYISPILAANGGWCLIQGTPRGRNHFFHLYTLAKELPEWKVFMHRTSDIHHVPESILEQERAMMDEGTFLQEYECSFERGISGSYFGTYIDQLRLRGQIGPVAWEPGLLVHLAIDIGVNDATTLIWFQIVGEGICIKIIDCHSNNGLGLDYYAKLIQDKPYRYGKMFAPADIKVREWGGGAVTRYEKARQLGLDFTLLEQVPIMDGIENIWTHFNKFWIDEGKCKSLIHAMESYRREWNETRGMYDDKPVKSWANHYCDALRYLCQGIHKTKKGMSKEDFEAKRVEALYGNNSMLPRILDPKFERYRQ